MNDLIIMLTKLYISNVRYKGVSYITDVIFNIDDIKKIMNYERLTVDKFIESQLSLLSHFGINVEKIDDFYVNFKLNANTKLSSPELIELYQEALRALQSEADSTGDYSKL